MRRRLAWLGFRRRLVRTMLPSTLLWAGALALVTGVIGLPLSTAIALTLGALVVQAALTAVPAPATAAETSRARPPARQECPSLRRRTAHARRHRSAQPRARRPRGARRRRGRRLGRGRPPGRRRSRLRGDGVASRPRRPVRRRSRHRRRVVRRERGLDRRAPALGARRGSAGRVCESGTPLACNDLPGTAECLPETTGVLRLSRFACVPMEAGGGAMGFIEVGDRPSEYTADEVRCLRLVARHTARRLTALADRERQDAEQRLACGSAARRARAVLTRPRVRPRRGGRPAPAR